MSIKNDLKSITEAIVQPANKIQPRPARQSTTSPGQLAHFSAQQQILEKEIEAAKKQAGAPRLLKLSQLRPSPYQTRLITEESIKELAANLEHNALTTPIVVREIEPGVFEIIAGHRRHLAFSLLGRDEIPAIVVYLNDEKTEAAVFYDNFFPPELSDYEKYLGLLSIQTRHQYSYDDLSIRSGCSLALIGLIMSFKRLPDEALTILKERPRLIGANLAAKIAKLNAPLDRIVDALQMIADGKLKQAKAIDWIQQKEIESKPPQEIVVKSGKTNFAKVQRRQGRLTINLTSTDKAGAIEKEIVQLLKQIANRDK